MEAFEEDIQQSLSVLKNGGIILYPTDTVWGIGCDATDEKAVSKVYALKKRSDEKSLIVLLTSENEILRHVAAPDPSVFIFLEGEKRPTTVIFDGAIGFAANMVAKDGSVAMRLVQDQFCRHLIKRLRKPLVSTSANISGMPAPSNFFEISNEIKGGVDYVVQWRQQERSTALPSKIIRWKEGKAIVLRG